MAYLARRMLLDWPNFLRLVSQQVYEEQEMRSLPPEQEELLKEAVQKLEESGEVKKRTTTLWGCILSSSLSKSEILMCLLSSALTS